MYINNAQTIAGTTPDALEAAEQSGFDFHFQLCRLLLQQPFLFARFLHDLIQFIAFLFQGTLSVFKQSAVGIQVLLLLFNLELSLFDFLVTKFNLQGLELDFLGQRVILTVVCNSIQLLVVTFQTCLCLNNVALLLGNRTLVVLDVLFDFLNTGVQTFQLVFQVAHLKRQFAAQCALLVDTGQCRLQLKEILQFFLYW